MTYRDPHCRFAAADPDRHVCRRNTGEEIRSGESCFAEARVQLASVPPPLTKESS